MLSVIPYPGETLSLLTAITWAVAVILFKKSGETVHPVALNLFKILMAIVLLAPTIWLTGGTIFRDVPSNDYLLLIISGALGIGVADTLFFKMLNSLGAGLTAIVDCLYSPFVILLSVLFLGESMNLFQFLGAALIVSAVLTAASRKGSEHLNRKELWKGIAYGALAMATNAVGIVMIKPLLTRSPLLWVTEIRLIGGLAVLSLALLVYSGRKKIVSSIMTTKRLKYTLSGSFVGTYIAMVMWLGGMKYTQASISAVLNQTSSIFVFILAALFLREKVNFLRTVGIVLGVFGAILVVLA